MAGKVFELEQVLLYRREMEKMRKQDFAAARHEVELANQILAQTEEQVFMLKQEFRNRQNSFRCIDEMLMYTHFFSRKSEEILQHKERIEYLDTVAEEKRSELMEASKDKKVLESLKEKKALQFKQAMAVKERDFLDEISIQKKVMTT